MNIANVTFNNNNGVRIAGRLYSSELNTGAGVIFSHGLFSNKDGYKITRLAADIVSTGNDLLTFDFSFVGESGGNIEDLSILQEVRDLGCAVQFMASRGYENIHLIGSSMGGAVSALHCSGQTGDVRSLVTIAMPVDIAGLMTRNAGIDNIDLLDDAGMTEIDGILIKNSFFKEAHLIDIIGALPNIHVPVLIFHGRQDPIVPVENAFIAERNITSPKELLIIPDGDHNLTRDGDLTLLKEKISGWLIRFN